MPKKIPKVNEVNEFKEIANNFSNPLEIVREAISNSIDANGNRIELLFDMIDYYGEDLFRVRIKDNGDGVSENELENFFDLGNSSRLDNDKSIGEKGHGTKIYFNSRQVILKSWKDGKYIEAEMKNISKQLYQDKIPKYEYSVKDCKNNKKGTEIEIIDYNRDKFRDFKHEKIKDYILWKTKFGAVDREFKIDNFNNYKLTLKGLDAEKPEKIEFGHIFPNESASADKLYDKYNNKAPNYFCKRWTYTGTLDDHPYIKFQAVFYVEGKNVKYGYNNMLRRQGYKAPDGSYTIQERYGLWLTKDFIPIQRKNEWITSKGSEYTKFHAFFNCQKFSLTANRGSVEATSPKVLSDIENKIKDIYEEITSSDDYEILDWLQGQAKGYETVNKEEKEYKRRKKNALTQKIAKYKGVNLYQPQLESGVHALLMQMSILEPDLFPFQMIDYNTNTGIDVLVKKKDDLSVDQSRIFYIELKNILDKNFNHSFKFLHSIICWDTELVDGDEVIDISKKQREFEIHNPEDENDYTHYYLHAKRDSRKIEVFVLKDYLKEKLNIDFRPRKSD